MADFSAAQKRILERRAMREEALTAADNQYRDSRLNSLVRLPPALRSLALESLSLYDVVESPYGTRPAFRVGQVDAELLDEALLGLLKKQAGEGLKLYGSHLKDDWDAEITAVLRAISWKLSIWDHGTSYGASLQGLKYIDARGDPIASTSLQSPTKLQRALHGLITVGGRYAWKRWEEHLTSADNGYDEPTPLTRHLSRATTLLTTSHNIAGFLSFLVFLYNGRYRTLTDRLLRLRLVPSSNQTSREVSFEWLNRQLVWHAFTEFLLFLLPLVGITRWRRWAARAWKKTRVAFARLWASRGGSLSRSASGDGVSSTLLADDDDEDDLPKGELAFLPERTCAICYQDQNPAGGQSEQDVLAGGAAGANTGIIGSATTDVTNPYETVPCGCIYCFVCLAQRIEAEDGEGWTCLRCGEVVKECRPWNGDVLVERPAGLLTGAARGEKVGNGVGSEGGGQMRRKKSVVFDLQDDEGDDDDDESFAGMRRRMNGRLEDLDPMPLEEVEQSMEWSAVDVEDAGDDGDSYYDEDNSVTF